MLQQTDRLALAVPDADKAAAGLNKIFDSIVVGDIKDNEANARRVTLQWGCDQLELFEPQVAWLKDEIKLVRLIVHASIRMLM